MVHAEWIRHALRRRRDRDSHLREVVVKRGACAESSNVDKAAAAAATQANQEAAKK